MFFRYCWMNIVLHFDPTLLQGPQKPLWLTCSLKMYTLGVFVRILHSILSICCRSEVLHVIFSVYTQVSDQVAFTPNTSHARVQVSHTYGPLVRKHQQHDTNWWLKQTQFTPKALEWKNPQFIVWKQGIESFGNRLPAPLIRAKTMEVLHNTDQLIASLAIISIVGFYRALLLRCCSCKHHQDSVSVRFFSDARLSEVKYCLSGVI